MQGRIHTVEQAHVLAGQGMGKASSAAGAIGQVGGHRLPEAVVLGIDGVVIGGDGSNRLHHLGAGAHGVLVEIQAQQPPAPLQGRAIGLQPLDLWTGQRRGGRAWQRQPRRGQGHRNLPHILSRVAMPSSPRPSLRVSAVRRQRARRDGRAAASALSTGTWS